MKRLGILTVFAGLVLAAGVAEAQLSQNDEVVQRGGYSATAPFATTVKGVQVIRGHQPEPAGGVKPLAQVFQIAAPRFQPLGDGLFYDSDRNRMISCFRNRGTQVGQVRLRCVSRRLGR